MYLPGNNKTLIQVSTSTCQIITMHTLLSLSVLGRGLSGHLVSAAGKVSRSWS